MVDNPIPTKAFDDLVEQEIRSLAIMLAESGKSISIVVVAASGEIAETYHHVRAKRVEDRVGLLQGLADQTVTLHKKWGF
jgi:hypothetical protein